MGVKLLPDSGKVEGGHDHMYGTPNYQRLRRFIGSIVARKKTVMLVVGGLFVIAILGLGVVQQQFFPVSDRPAVLVEFQMPDGTWIEATSTFPTNVEAWNPKPPEAHLVTTYVCKGAPRSEER